MALYTYDEALRRLLVHEGGYSNHPSDPGGPTNFGITIHDYRMYINPKGTARDVRALKVEQAKKIFRAKYWDALRCDELPPGVDYAVFDYGVNSGIGRAGKVLRRLLALKDSTHVVTDDVVRAAHKRDAAVLVDAICAERMKFLQALRTWNVFGRGWTRRVQEVRNAARAMATNSAKKVPQTPNIVGSPKVKEPSPVAKTATGVIAAAGAGFVAVYNWAIENPLLAALIIQAFIVVVYVIVHAMQEQAKPTPVPESFEEITGKVAAEEPVSDADPVEFDDRTPQPAPTEEIVMAKTGSSS